MTDLEKHVLQSAISMYQDQYPEAPLEIAQKEAQNFMIRFEALILIYNVTNKTKYKPEDLIFNENFILLFQQIHTLMKKSVL